MRMTNKKTILIHFRGFDSDGNETELDNAVYVQSRRNGEKPAWSIASKPVTIKEVSDRIFGENDSPEKLMWLLRWG